MHYDYLIVGAGLFGATFCYEAVLRGKKCLVIDKRDHVGGNIYTEEIGNHSIKAFSSSPLSPESWWLNFQQHTNEYSPPGWEEVLSQLYNRKGQTYCFYFFLMNVVVVV